MATRHNEEVSKEALRLKREGFKKIKAAIPGYEPPDPIGQSKRIPDIEATKSGKRIIAEIEEEKQVAGQKEQIAAFRRHASQKRNTGFVLRTYQRGKKGSRRTD